VALVLAAAACGGTASPGATGPAGGTAPAGGKQPLDVVLLVGGRINDGGFTQTMYDALVQVAEKDGAVNLTYRELLAQGGQTAFDNAVREFAAKPEVDLIVAHGIDLVTSVDKFAPQFPNARFVTSFFLPSGQIPPNVNLYISNFEEIGYAAGFLVAQTTRTGHVGFIGGPEFPFLHQELFGFQQALEDYLPAGTAPDVEVIFTGDWEDVQKGREAALTMAEEGVDSLWSILAGGNSGVISTCVERDIWCVGNSFYTEPLGPAAVPASAVHGAYGVLIEPWLQAIRDGTWEEQFGGKQTPLTLQNGVTTVTDATPAGAAAFPELQAAIEQFRADATAGRIQVERCDLPACTG
jgi:basic membrane protein A